VSVLLILAIVFGLYMAWNIGANDVANSMANAVGSKAITVLGAVILASIFEFSGAFFVGAHVTETVRNGIIAPEAFAADPNSLALGLVCALLAAAIWLNIATYLGMPVSTTHAIVGAIAGFGLLTAGLGHVQWGTMGQIVASWFISPLAGGIIAYFCFMLIARFVLAGDNPVSAAIYGVPVTTFGVFFVISMGTIYKGLKNIEWSPSPAEAVAISAIVGIVAAGLTYLALQRLWRAEAAKQGTPQEQLARVEGVFVVLVIITSCSVAFAHGANDVANAIGPLASVVEIVNNPGQLPTSVGIPNWVLALGGGGIVLGLSTFGYRVMRTVGTDITDMTPSRGVAADIGTTITVLTCSNLGLPISTTHTLVGAIVGVGLARGITAINRAIMINIFFSWIATLPFVGVLTAVLYVILKHVFGL
jgi:PiT family inorganic phosphate transporter